jgi:hypothetical protein
VRSSGLGDNRIIAMMMPSAIASTAMTIVLTMPSTITGTVRKRPT